MKPRQSFRAIVSTPRLDALNSVLHPLGCTAALPVPVLVDHEAIVGDEHIDARFMSDADLEHYALAHVVAIHKDADKVVAEIVVSDHDGGDALGRLVSSGAKRHASVLFSPIQVETRDGIDHILKWRIREVSILSESGANPDAVVIEIDHA